MYRKTCLGLLVVCLVGSCLAGGSASGQEWAKKMFKVTRHDFGQVAKGAKTEFAFEISNIYMEDVHITGVRSSCGCTTPRIEKPLLKTYEKGAIVAKYNTHAFSGSKGATLTVTFDKPFPATVRLSVSGVIRSDVVIDPNSVQLGSIDRGSPTERRVTVTRSGRSDWQITGVNSTNPHLTGRVEQRRRRYGRVSYELIVRLDEQAPAGYLKNHLMLATNDRHLAQVPVLVEGHVQSAITVSPASLFMGVVEPGTRVTKRLVVRGKEPFRILSIGCEDESFEFDAEVGSEAKSIHVVPVTSVAGTESGKVIKTIRIETDLDEVVPELAAYAVVSP